MRSLADSIDILHSSHHHVEALSGVHNRLILTLYAISLLNSVSIGPFHNQIDFPTHSSTKFVVRSTIKWDRITFCLVQYLFE